jgi:hypothetical protein
VEERAQWGRKVLRHWGHTTWVCHQHYHFPARRGDPGKFLKHLGSFNCMMGVLPTSWDSSEAYGTWGMLKMCYYDYIAMAVRWKPREEIYMFSFFASAFSTRSPWADLWAERVLTVRVMSGPMGAVWTCRWME